MTGGRDWAREKPAGDEVFAEISHVVRFLGKGECDLSTQCTGQAAVSTQQKPSKGDQWEMALQNSSGVFFFFPYPPRK